jgi:hypothetical protein
MPEPIARRQFISAAAAMALLGGAGITIACGGSSLGTGPTPPPPPPGTSSKFGTVGTNHGHTAVIQGASLDAGGALTLDIQGSAAHTHSVTLTAQQVVSIRGGTQVTVQASITDPGLGPEFIHGHSVTFN